MQYLIGGAVGIVIWQVLTATIYLLSDEDEEKLVYFGLCLPCAVLFLIGSIYKKLRLWYARRHYNRYRWCCRKDDGRVQYCTYSYMTTETAMRFYRQGQSSHWIEVEIPGRKLKYAPSKSEIYKGGVPRGMTLDFFTKFCKNR